MDKNLSNDQTENTKNNQTEEQPNVLGEKSQNKSETPKTSETKKTSVCCKPPVLLPLTLEARFKGADLKAKMATFEELEKWTDETMTKEYFLQNLHFYIKQKYPAFISKLMGLMITFFKSEDPKMINENLIIHRFLENYCEHFMNNISSKKVKNDSVKFFVTLFEILPKDITIDTMSNLLFKLKPKIKIKALTCIYELVKAGKIVELQFMQKFYDAFEKTSVSRTLAIKKLTMDILKEAYYYMGDELIKRVVVFKESVKKELDKWVKTVDEKDMKIVEIDEKYRVKAIDLFAEVTISEDLYSNEWYETIMAFEDWKDKKSMLDDLIKVLEKAKKINPQMNPQNYFNLAEKLFEEKMVANQVAIVKIVGLCAEGLEHHFTLQALQIIPLLFGQLKTKNMRLSKEIINTLEKFHIFLSFTQIMEIYKINLFEVELHKKKKTLELVIQVLKKKAKKRLREEVEEMGKIMIELLKDHDTIVRENASEVIGLLKDENNEVVKPLILHLSCQEMGIIAKYCRDHSGLTIEDQKEKKFKEKKKNENFFNSTEKKFGVF